jgi:acetyl esterase/lipase
MSPADPREVLTRPAPPPDHVLRYGPGPDQVADLRLPPGLGMDTADRAPALILLLHGGFWRAAYDRKHLGPLAAALAAENFLVCTPEFRRTGQPGGGWPGTFDDVAAAVDRLPGLARSVLGGAVLGGAAGPGQIILAGHSAGGHLALWSAGRHRLSPASPWHRPLGECGAAGSSGANTPGRARQAVPVTAAAGVSGVSGARVAGVVALAPISDVAACYRAGLDHDAAGELLGGGPAEQPSRYAVADPARLVPLGVPVHIVHGTADDRVPFAMSREFAARAQAAGDPVTLDVLAGGGHFGVIDPLSADWPVVLAAFRAVAAQA